jgi:hypothetical protein
MAVNLSPVGGVAAQFFNNNGVILSGGKIYTYAAGTTTNQATYTSSNGGTAHSNPIILDSAGRVPSGEIWLTDGLQYKFVITTSADVLIGTYDNIIGINSNFVNFTNEQEIQTATAGQTVFTLTTMQYQPATGSLSVFVDGVNQYGPGAQYAYIETSSTVVTFISGLHVGASVKFTTSAINASSYGTAFDISYTPPFTASVATNVGDKLAQTVSVKDFGAIGDGVTDDYIAIVAAINSLPAAGGKLFFPTGAYLHNTKITIAKNVYITGCGNSIQSSTTGPTELIKGAGIAGNGIELTADGITIEHLNYRGAVGNSGDGFVLLGGRQTLRDVSVFTMGQDGIRIGRDGAGGNQNLWCLINIRSKSNGRNGLRIEDKISPLAASDCNAGSLLHADIQSNTGDGVYVGNTGLNTFVGLVCQSNGGYGALLDANATFNSFYGGDFEANTLDELRLLAGATRNSFLGISISGTAVDLGSNTSFVGCDGLGSPAGLIVPNVGDPNLKCLDWYQEGTFTPTFEGTTTPGVGTYSVQVGRYTRIGNVVRFAINLISTAHTGTGDLIVKGLPFVSASSPSGRTNVLLNSTLLTYGAGIPFGYIDDSSSTIILYLQASNAAITSIAMDVTAGVFIQGTYQV